MDRFEAEIKKILESAIERTQPPAKKHILLMAISITMTVVAMLTTTWLAATTAENKQLKDELQQVNLQQVEHLKKVVDPLSDCKFIITLDGVESCDPWSSSNYL